MTVDLDALDKLREEIGDSPVFRVIGFEQDDEEVLALFDDGGKSIFAECYGSDAAALIAASLAALPDLLAEVRRGRALREAVEKLIAFYDRHEYSTLNVDDLRSVLAAVDAS